MSAPARSSGTRARARRRLDLTILLAVVLPLATLGAVALVSPRSTSDRPQEPVPAALERVDLGCPRGFSDRAVVRVVAQPDAAGDVAVRTLADSAGDPVPAAVAAGAVTDLTERQALVVSGRDRLAPGLRALRVDGARLAAVACALPTPETWFAGLGARSTHASRLQLTNPDRGAAIVDVTLYSARGTLDEPDLRGVRVPGRTSIVVDLAAAVPRRGELAARVQVSRGRVATAVLDARGRPGRRDATREWLPPQQTPGTETTLLGVPPGRGARMVVVANPGDSEARVSVKIVSRESVFAPADVPELRLPPGFVGKLSLAGVLNGAVGRDALGVVVESSQPVVASLSSRVGDMALTSGGSRISAVATSPVPRGNAQVVLAGASAPGVATVATFAADGTELSVERVELVPDEGAAVALPRRAAMLRLTLERTSVVASLLVTGDGAVSLPLSESVLEALLPQVRPAG